MKLVIPLRFEDGQSGCLELHRSPERPLLFDVNLLFGKLRRVIEQTVSRLPVEAPDPRRLHESFFDSGSTLLPKITRP
ncbi:MULTISPECIES: hypothetical protein [Chloracidobacterium]|uniref:hypothetical protein n=1 Tax=Chloracidobacterium TaxID=458032 RepID=UPI001B8AB2BC|nr:MULTISPECIES: hypothetical protein [Chloracidobacterium]QUV83308.1 hypothetical protein J8C01_11525 [Chloracidobacterium sp. D]QUV92793.1 hypothetical protein J8C04_13725 [Chloracidobacterium sp. A]